MTAKGVERFLRDLKHPDIDDEILFSCAFNIIIAVISCILTHGLFSVIPIVWIQLPFFIVYIGVGGVLFILFSKGKKISIRTRYLYRGCTSSLLAVSFLIYLIGFVYALNDKFLLWLGIFAIVGITLGLITLTAKKGISRRYTDDSCEEGVSASKFRKLGVIGTAGAPLGFFIAWLIMSSISAESMQSNMIPLILFSTSYICSIVAAGIFYHTAYLIHKFNLSSLEI